MGIVLSKDLPFPEDINPKIDINNKNTNESDSSEENISRESNSSQEILNNEKYKNNPINTNDNSSDCLLSNTQQLENNIENFIEEWFKENQQVDLGNIKILNQEIDLIPDSVEKKIYKKALLIAVTFLKKTLTETKINLMNQEITISISNL